LRSQESLSKRRWSDEDSKINIVCSFCDNNIKKYPSFIGKKNNFCDMECRDKYVLKKYDALYDTFENNIDEVAYLFGLMLGDGHLRKMDQKNTTRVDISFNTKEKDMIKLAKNVMSKLEINFYSQIQKNCNCLHLGFILPDNLLKKYDMLWIGSKFHANPYPVERIMENINFVAGLINSDGWCGHFHSRKNLKRIVFCNTVRSIVDSLESSLGKNKIDYRCYHRDGVIDKRTKKKNKEQWVVSINKKETISKLINECSYNLKEFKV